MSLINKLRKLLADSRRRREQEQQSALENEFHQIGYFAIEKAQTIQENFICKFWFTSTEPLDAFVYLFVVNGTVKYVGETGNGIARFNGYRYDTSEGQGKRVSNHIFDAVMIEGKKVEVFIKEASCNATERKASESHYKDFFDTKRDGWNIR